MSAHFYSIYHTAHVINVHFYKAQICCCFVIQLTCKHTNTVASVVYGFSVHPHTAYSTDIFYYCTLPVKLGMVLYVYIVALLFCWNIFAVFALSLLLFFGAVHLRSHRTFCANDHTLTTVQGNQFADKI